MSSFAPSEGRRPSAAAGIIFHEKRSAAKVPSLVGGNRTYRHGNHRQATTAGPFSIEKTVCALHNYDGTFTLIHIIEKPAEGQSHSADRLGRGTDKQRPNGLLFAAMSSL